jgi:Tol biopolymer transport system component
VSVPDPAHKAVPFHPSRSREQGAAFSPDGKYLAYRSNESGRNEVFVQSLAQNGGRWQISTAGGDEPCWRRDGKELYYVAQTDFMAVDVQVKGEAVVAGFPRTIQSSQHPATQTASLPRRTDRDFWSSSRTGRLTTRINIVVNWPGLQGQK